MGNNTQHFTSAEVIDKVLNPLILDELFAEHDKVFVERVKRIRLFDPACGNGNFFARFWKRIKAESGRRGIVDVPRPQFFGVELDARVYGFCVSRLEQLGFDAGNIVAGNAIRMDWEEVCPLNKEAETYIAGNPPFSGSSKQTKEQKEDYKHYFGNQKHSREVDYVGLWFLKSADYLQSDLIEGAALVSTNSICQGQQVPYLWPIMFSKSVKISFAHTSFMWSNLASKGAGVACVVVGLQRKTSEVDPVIYHQDKRVSVNTISGYLKAMRDDLIVKTSSDQISGAPKMEFGNKPTDGGYLSLSPAEKDDLILADSMASEYIRQYLGAAELLDSKERYCLWIDDKQAAQASSIPKIKQRLAKVSEMRLASKDKATKSLATSPHRFQQRRVKEAAAILVPAVSSERREYIPMAFIGPGAVPSNRVYVIYQALPYTFGVLHSKMHMSWVSTVTGRLETRFSYSSDLCYNPFPFPVNSEKYDKAISDAALEVLAARERFPDHTLAELYDPDKMPHPLRQAHNHLDSVVDEAYKPGGFKSDDERLAHLFEMYEKLTKKPKFDKPGPID